MKKLLFAALLALAPSAHALNIDIRPLALKAQAEVLGVQVGVDGTKAIVLTGQAAKKVAQAAGYTLNTSKELIVLTGKEVNQLVQVTLRTAGAAGKNALIFSADLTRGTFNLVGRSLHKGAFVVTRTAKYTNDVAQYVVKSLVKFAKLPLIVVRDTGTFAYNTGKQFLTGFWSFSKGIIGSIIGIFH